MSEKNKSKNSKQKIIQIRIDLKKLRALWDRIKTWAKQVFEYWSDHFKFFTQKSNWNRKTLIKRFKLIISEAGDALTKTYNEFKLFWKNLSSILKGLIVAVFILILSLSAFRAAKKLYSVAKYSLRPELIAASIYNNETNVDPEEVIYFDFSKKIGQNWFEKVFTAENEGSYKIIPGDSANRVGVIAEGGWLPDKEYTLNLDSDYFKKSHIINFTTVSSPKIVANNLSSHILPGHTFLFAYNQEVFNKSGSGESETQVPEDFIKFEPAVSGKTEVLSPSMIRFTPDKPLEARNYKLSLGSQELIGSTGLHQTNFFESDFIVTAETESSSSERRSHDVELIINETRNVREDTNDPVYILLNQDIDRKLFSEKLSFRFEEDTETGAKIDLPGIKEVKYYFISAEEADDKFKYYISPGHKQFLVAEVIPDSPWSKAEAQIQLVIAPGISLINGSGKTEKEKYRRIDVKEDIKYVRTNLANVEEYEDWYRTARFAFNNELIHSDEEIQNLVRVYDKNGVVVPLQKLRVVNWTGEIVFTDILSPGEEYTIVFSRNITDVFGSRLDKDVSVDFTYPRILKPDANGKFVSIFGTDFAMVDNSVPHQIYLRSRGYEEVYVEFARIHPEEAIEILEADSVEIAGQKAATAGQVVKYDTKPFHDVKFEEGSGINDTSLEFQYEIKDIPDGLYIARVQSMDGEHRDYKIMSFTTASALLKVSRPEDELFVWLSDLRDGKPISGKSLKLRSKNSELGSLETNKSGVSIFRDFIDKSDYEIKSYDDLYVFSPDGSIFTSTDFDNTMNPRAFLDRDEVATNPMYNLSKDVFTYIDKPIYRVGDTLHAKFFLRDLADNQNLPYIGEFEVTIEKYSDDKPKISRIYNTNEYGTAHGKFKLTDEFKPGEYSICVHGYRHCERFLLQEFQPLRYTFNVNKDSRKTYKPSDTVELGVDANYYFGEPLANAEVEVNLFVRDDYFTDFYSLDEEAFPVDDFSKYSLHLRDIWDDDYEYYDSLKIGTYFGRTDSNGKLSVKLPFDVPEPYASQNPKLLSIEVAVTDELGEKQYRTLYGKVLPKGGMIGLFDSDPVVEEGQTFFYEFEALYIDEYLNPKSSAPVEFSLYRVEYSQVRSQLINRDYYWENVSNEVLEDRVVVNTDSDGKAVAKLTPKSVDENTDYYIVAKSLSYPNVVNRRMKYGYHKYWSDLYDTYNSEQMLEIDTDKGSYKLGDTAQLAPKIDSGKYVGLLTYERKGIVEYKVIDFRSDNYRNDLKLEISDDIKPNIFASLYAFTPHDSGSEFIDYRFGVVQIKVDEPELLREINVTYDKESYLAGETVTVNIDNPGVEEQTEYLVAAVDKAVLDLSLVGHYPNVLEMMKEDLWESWNLGIASSSNITEYENKLINEIAWGNKGGAAGGGGGGYYSLEQEDIRNKFEDVAVWLPEVSSETGDAQISFSTPDNLTTWQLVVLGISKSGAISAQKAEFRVSKDVNIISQIPDKMYLDDEIEISVNPIIDSEFVQRNLNSGLKVEVTVDSGTIECGQNYVRDTERVDQVLAEEIQSTPSQSCLIEREHSDFPLPVIYRPSEVGKTSIRMTVGTEEKAYDSLEREIEIIPQSNQNTIISYGDTLNDNNISVKFPDRAYDKSLTVNFTNDVIGDLEFSREFFYNYQNLCSEQTSSTILGLLPGIDQNDEYRQKAQQMVDYLTQMQNFDGGWSYWGEGSSRVYNSAYVVYALSKAKASGLDVPDATLANGIDFLNDQHDDYTVTHLNETFMRYVLSESGKFDFSRIDSRYRRIGRNSSTIETHALFLGIYNNYLNSDEIQLGQRALVKERIREIETYLLDNLIVRNQTAKWGEAQEFEEFWDFYRNDTKVTALTLDIMLDSMGGDESLIPVVNYLKTELQTKKLGTLSMYYVIDALENAKEKYDFSSKYVREVEINGVTYNNFEITESGRQLTIPLDNEVKQLGITAVSQEGKLVYFDAKADYKVALADQPESDSGAAIYVEVLDDDQVLKKGDQYKVRAYVALTDTSEPYRPTEIRIPVAAGLTPVNFNLAPTASDSMKDELYQLSSEFDNAEYLSNEVVFYAGSGYDGLKPGFKQYEFYVNATNRGRFTVPGGNVQEMYLPGRSSIQDSNVIYIQ
ncbi:hypothetical protein GF357_00430 [Candidatus Dojkabacteria bacterium]|nr:hypothetical protein [Candidatus Dojkabacteria bacterium]